MRERAGHPENRDLSAPVIVNQPIRPPARSAVSPSLAGMHPSANRRRPAVSAAALALSLALPLLCAPLPRPAFAQDAASAIQIAAQPLGDALLQLGRQTDLQFFYPSELVHGLTAPDVRGELTPEQALRQLLQGSGLTWRRVANRITLERTPAPAGATSKTLPAVSVTASALRSATTEGSGSYTTSEVSVARGQSLREIPQSVSVITRQQMDDQQMVTLDDVMQAMPGVTTGGLGLGGRGNAYYTRGLAASSVQIDGVADFGLLPSGLNLEGSNLSSMVIYDHVEVLRGADGLYGGLGDSAGTINLVRKRPTAEAQTKVNLSAGSWDTYQAEADLSGPLAFDGRLRGRLVAARRDAGYFTEYAKSRSDLLYAIGELDLGPGTRLTLGGHYNHERGTPQGGELMRNRDGSDPRLPRRTSLVAPWSTFTKENTNVFAELRHQFNQGWQTQASINHNRNRNNRYYAVIGQPADEANIRLRGGAYPGKTLAWDVHLKGQGQLGSRRWDVLLGADGQSEEMFYDFLWNFDYIGSAYNRSPIADPRNIDWALYPRPRAFGLEDRGRLNEAQRGLYGRVKVELIPDLHLIAGARTSRFRYQYTNTGYDATGQVTGVSNSQYRESGIVTPYAGLVYDVNAAWTVYTSIANVYRSQASALKGPPPGGGPVDPMEGRNVEIGAKAELGRGFTTSFALYRLERTGDSARDTRYDFVPGDLGSCCFVNRGETVSQGVDMEIQGELLPGLQVSASHVYNSVSDKTDGSVPYNTTVAPRHSAKLWSRYQLPGTWSALAIGGGLTAQSRTYAEGSAFYFAQGGYLLANLFTTWQLDRRWQLGMNVSNLFDRHYYASITEPSYGNYYGEPRRFTLSLKGTL